NLLFVSSLDGGIAAYDISDPASLSATPPAAARPIAKAPAFPQTGAVRGESWAVTVDHHGRVYSTALTDLFGVLRTYRVEQFAAGLDATEKPLSVDTPYATSIISWRPGINVGAPLGTTMTTITDRAEATPRKLQIAEQDDELVVIGGTDFDSKLVGASPVNSLGAKATPGILFGEAKSYTISVPPKTGFAYRTQRITILNESLGVRWSEDADAAAATRVTFTNVLVRNGDRIRILRNETAYAVVSLFGFGVGVFGLDVHKGIAEVSMVPKAGGVESTGNGSTVASDFVRQPGLPFTASYSGGNCATAVCHHEVPQLALIRDAFTKAGRTLDARF